jgi:hypothetical protein
MYNICSCFFYVMGLEVAPIPLIPKGPGDVSYRVSLENPVQCAQHTLLYYYEKGSMDSVRACLKNKMILYKHLYRH